MTTTSTRVIGFTGTRNGMSYAQKAIVTEFLTTAMDDGNVEVHHGDCVGADSDFHLIARTAGAYVVGHPPTAYGKRAYCSFDEAYEPSPYLVRNQKIVDLSDVVIACPAESKEQLRGGTWSMVRKARAVNKPLAIVWPNGDVSLSGAAT